jgi:hypothetical protein
MTKQPEAKVSTKIMKEWRRQGAWCYKVWGSEFQMSGVPDISGVYEGRSVWCETKMPGNKPSPIQWYRIDQIRASGGFVVIAYSVSEALEMLQHIDDDICAHERETCTYRANVDLLEEGL